MKNWLILAAVAALFYFYLRPQKIHTQNLFLTPAKANTAGGKTCFDKPKCIVVYLAPWCPHCTRTAGLAKELVAQFTSSSDVGMMAFVGMDQPEANEKFAASIGDYSFVDNDGEVRKEFKVRGVPSWFVMNDRGKVLKKFSGSPNPATVASISYLLELEK